MTKAWERLPDRRVTRITELRVVIEATTAEFPNDDDDETKMRPVDSESLATWRSLHMQEVTLYDVEMLDDPAGELLPARIVTESTATVYVPDCLRDEDRDEC